MDIIRRDGINLAGSSPTTGCWVPNQFCLEICLNFVDLYVYRIYMHLHPGVDFGALIYTGLSHVHPNECILHDGFSVVDSG